MKKLLISLVVVLTLVLLLPFTLGILTKRSIEQNISKSVERKDSTVTLQIVEYHRGWFSSSAKLKFIGNNAQGNLFLAQVDQLKDTTLDKQASAQDITLTIHHGPFILADGKWSVGLAKARAQLNLHFKSQDDKSLQALIDNQPILAADLLWTITGDTRIEIKSAKFHWLSAQDNNFKMNWDGMTLNYSLARNGFDRTLEFTAAPIDIQDSKTQLSIDQVHAASKLRQGLPYLVVGEFEANTTQFNLQNISTSMRLEMHNVNLQAASQLMGNQYSLSSQINVEQLKVDQKKANLQFDVGMDSLDAQALSQYYQLLLDANDRDGATKNLSLLFNAVPLLEKAFSGAKLHVKLNSITELGLLSAKLDFSAPKQISIFTSTSKGIQSLITEAAGNADVRVSKKLLQDRLNTLPLSEQDQFRKQLNESVKNGLISEKDEEYLAHISLKNGKIYFNGNEVYSLI